MIEVTFLAKPVVKVITNSISTTIIEKLRIKWKLKKIKKFNKEFNGIRIEGEALQHFLNQENNVHMIFNYTFGAKEIQVDRDLFIKQLSKLALEDINEQRKNNELEMIDEHSGLEPYFIDLLQYLEKYRDEKFTSSQSNLIANVQSSIMESNKDLKQYLANNFHEIQEQSQLKNLSDQRVEELLEKAIQDLGRRYLPKANVETNFDIVFDELALDQQIFNKFEKLSNDMNNNIDALNERLENYKKILGTECLLLGKQIVEYLKQIDFYDTNFYQKDNLQSFMSNIDQFRKSTIHMEYYIDELSEENVNPKTKETIKIEVIPFIKKFQAIEKEVEEHMQSLKTPEVMKYPYLLIHGEAGIGKSHLLADNAKRLEASGHSVFLFLGQNFTVRENPIKQLLNRIEFKGKKSSFLEEFNRRAREKNKRTFIIIDAINEGEGKFFWKGHLLSFLNTINHYENIAVVLSVRSNYKQSVLPKEIYQDFPLQTIEHRGFKELNLDSLAPFFEYYDISPAVFPSLESECYNPLFLQIYCDVFKKEKGIYKGWSISEVVEKYIQNANERLSMDERFSYPGSVNLIDKILKQMCAYFIEHGSYQIDLKEFQRVLRSEAEDYTGDYRKLIIGLEEESILSTGTDSQGNGFVYFTYERFADIYMSLILLEKYQETPKLLKQLDKIDSMLYQGVYESLSIVLPEKMGVELLDLYDSTEVKVDIVEAFVLGLSWRNVQNMSEQTLYWVNKCLKQNNNYWPGLVYEKILKHAYIPNSPLNAEFLHENLSELSMPTRDRKWTTTINDNTEVPLRLVDMIMSKSLSFQQLTPQSLDLLSYSMIWFLTSTNQRLRDSTTVALTTLYIREPRLILSNLKKFIYVDDPYVMERLFASSYGAILRTHTIPNLEEIVDVIHTNIFSEEIYPNVLVRDYARGIVLFVDNLIGIQSIQSNSIDPPYASSWYEKEYTNEDIDHLLMEMKSKASNHRSGFKTIVDSMTTEYGRGISQYGDFGRYVFGHAVKDWKNQFDDQILSNIAIKMILDYGYSEEFHGEYDSNVHHHSRYGNLIERIGKKYQWIALYELVARLTDNYPIYEERKIYTEEYEQQINNGSFFDLIKTPKEKEAAFDLSELSDEEFNQMISDYDTEELANAEEEINKRFLEEQKKHFVETKIDYKSFKGPWDPFLRNIDPTLLAYPPIKNNNGYLIKFNFPKGADKNWAQSKEEFDHLEDFLYVDYNDQKFVSLAQLLNKQEKLNEKIVDRNEFTSKSKAVFIAQSEKEHYIHWKKTEKSDLSASWGSSYSVFAFEYYWHPSIVDEYYIDDHKKIAQEDAVWEYLWENNISSISQERGSCSYFLPNKKLVDYFNLKQTSEGHWKDENNNLVAFDAKYAGFESNLLFSADYLKRYLNDQKLSIVWDFYMEKVSERNKKEEWYIAWENEEQQIEHVILEENPDTDMQDMF